MSNYSFIESAYDHAGSVHHTATVGLGPVSKAETCVARHFSNGACWGTFSDEATAFVNKQDPVSDCAPSLSKPLTTSTVYVTPSDQAISSTAMWVPNTGGHVQGAVSGTPYGASSAGPRDTAVRASYGAYSSCPNCEMSGYGNYSRGNCHYAEKTSAELGTIYDPNIHASEYFPQQEVTYAVEYAGDMDPFRQRPYGGPTPLAPKTGAGSFYSSCNL